jgi:purine nucleosidase
MKRVIIDTDIGTDVDDAMALSLAALSPQLDIVGVTTVHADATLRARVARKLLSMANREDIPVIAGASLPLQMPLPANFTWMPKLRGHEGVGILEGSELIPSTEPNLTSDDAAKFIIDQAQQNQGELSIITIGPMSNVGRALQLEPRLTSWIHSLTLMGGTVYSDKFPFPPMLETNLNADPEAARLVFTSGIPLYIVPMEVTTQVYLTARQRQEMLQWNNPLATRLVALMEEMFEGMASLSAEAGLAEDFYLDRTFMHDPLAIYTAMSCQHITTRRMHVTYEVVDQVVRTVPHFDLMPNCWVCVNVDAKHFVEYWLEQIKKFKF